MAVLELQRPSLAKLIAEIQEDGPKAKGVLAVWIDEKATAHLRISGFAVPNNVFLICGLLDWIKADLMADLTHAEV